MTPVRRLVAAAIAIGLAAYSARLAFATPPATDPERKARVEEMYAGYAKGFPSVPALTAEQLMARLDDPQLVIVDVREPAERAVSVIPHAIDRETFEARRDELAGHPVVAYCTIGYRSGLWVLEQRDKGVDAYNLAGSLLSWTHAGGPLERDGQATRDLHVYGPRWNLAPASYRGVW